MTKNTEQEKTIMRCADCDEIIYEVKSDVHGQYVTPRFKKSNNEEPIQCSSCILKQALTRLSGCRWQKEPPKQPYPDYFWCRITQNGIIGSPEPVYVDTYKAEDYDERRWAVKRDTVLRNIAYHNSTHVWWAEDCKTIGDCEWWPDPILPPRNYT